MSQISKIFYQGVASVSFALSVISAFQSELVISGLYLMMTGVMVVMSGLSDAQR